MNNMERQTTLWLFQQNSTYEHSIIVQLGSWSEPTVIKVDTDDVLFYTVDYQTYENWNLWYGMKAKEFVKNYPTNKFEKVYVFDLDFYNELSNLDK